jgi:Tol biopolymer transport system component
MFGNKRTILLGLILALALLTDVANADYIFGTPTNLGPTVNSSAYDFNPSIGADGLELYFVSDRPGGEGTYDIWVSTRASKEDDWGAPTNFGAINTPDWQNSPCISPDGLEFYFNDWGIWVVRRATVSDSWGEPENDSLINVNASNANSGQCLSSDGLSLFLSSWDPWDLYVSTRPTRDDLWSEPVNLGPTVNGVNSTLENRDPAISADGLLLIFSSDRDGGYGRRDLWMTRRSTIDGPWSEPVNLGPTINIEKSEYAPEISADGRSLLFCSTRDGGHGDFDIWQASIDPVVDLNADGIVDAADMCIIVDNWGTDNKLCDVGPMPWGDGVVDVEDLIVIAEHLFEEFPPAESVE